MRRMKGLFAVLLAVALLLSGSVSVLAAPKAPAVYSKYLDANNNINAKVKSVGAKAIDYKMTTVKTKATSTGTMTPGNFNISNSNPLSWYRLDLKGFTYSGNKKQYGASSTVYLAMSPEVFITYYSLKVRKMKVTWKKQAGATGYKLYMRVGDNGSWKLKKTTTGSSYVSGVLQKDVKYYFKVVSYKTYKGKTFNSIPLNVLKYAWFYQ